MRNTYAFSFCLALLVQALAPSVLFGQSSSVIIPSNISTGSLEKNLLFYANQRYQVTRQGPDIVMDALFDGRFQSVTSATAPTASNPLVVLLEGLPTHHTQQGAWVGWSSRNWMPVNFKIEGYNTYDGANQWVTVANVTGHSQRHYMVKMPPGGFGKLRFSFYSASGANGLMQLSELFYIHPEAAQAYDGLLVKYHSSGNVGIGTTSPKAKLAVDGNILAKEIKIKTNISVPDYVFESDYNLPTLAEVEAYVKLHKHLPEIPSAGDINRDGLDLAEMNLLLLKKVEELTLYLLEKDKAEKQMISEIQALKMEVTALKSNKAK